MTQRESQITPTPASLKSRICKTILPEDFQPSEENKNLASELKLDIGTELRKFRDWHQSKGTESANWQSTLALWWQRGSDYVKSGKGSTSKSKLAAGPLFNSRDNIERYYKGATEAIIDGILTPIVDGKPVVIPKAVA